MSQAILIPAWSLSDFKIWAREEFGAASKMLPDVKDVHFEDITNYMDAANVYMGIARKSILLGPYLGAPLYATVFGQEQNRVALFHKTKGYKSRLVGLQDVEDYSTLLPPFANLGDGIKPVDAVGRMRSILCYFFCAAGLIRAVGEYEGFQEDLKMACACIAEKGKELDDEEQKDSPGTMTSMKEDGEKNEIAVEYAVKRKPGSEGGAKTDSSTTQNDDSSPATVVTFVTGRKRVLTDADEEDSPPPKLPKSTTNVRTSSPSITRPTPKHIDQQSREDSIQTQNIMSAWEDERARLVNEIAYLQSQNLLLKDMNFALEKQSANWQQLWEHEKKWREDTHTEALAIKQDAINREAALEKKAAEEKERWMSRVKRAEDTAAKARKSKKRLAELVRAAGQAAINEADKALAGDG